MNIIKIFTALIPFATCQFIEIRWSRRPVYISKLITDEHRDAIYNAMSQLGLQETEDKSENHIRIEYDNSNGGGGIEMIAATDYDGFYIYSTTIGINRLLDKNSFQCVILHELGHSLSLAHNEKSMVMKSILNNTRSYCHLSYIDIINLYNIGFYEY